LIDGETAYGGVHELDIKLLRCDLIQILTRAPLLFSWGSDTFARRQGPIYNKMAPFCIKSSPAIDPGRCLVDP